MDKEAAMKKALKVFSFLNSEEENMKEEAV